MRIARARRITAAVAAVILMSGCVQAPDPFAVDASASPSQAPPTVEQPAAAGRAAGGLPQLREAIDLVRLADVERSGVQGSVFPLEGPVSFTLPLCPRGAAALMTVSLDGRVELLSGGVKLPSVTAEAVAHSGEYLVTKTYVPDSGTFAGPVVADVAGGRTDVHQTCATDSGDISVTLRDGSVLVESVFDRISGFLVSYSPDDGEEIGRAPLEGAPPVSMPTSRVPAGLLEVRLTLPFPGSVALSEWPVELR